MFGPDILQRAALASRDVYTTASPQITFYRRDYRNRRWTTLPSYRHETSKKNKTVPKIEQTTTEEKPMEGEEKPMEGEGKPIDSELFLHVNRNCASCTLLGHDRLLHLERFNIIVHDNTDGTEYFPYLTIASGKHLHDVALWRHILGRAIEGKTDDEVRIMMTNDHRNCVHSE